MTANNNSLSTGDQFQNQLQINFRRLKEALSLLNTMNDPIKFRIIQFIQKSGNLTPTVLESHFDIEVNVREHLKALIEVKILETCIASGRLQYRINEQRLIDLKNLISICL